MCFGCSQIKHLVGFTSSAIFGTIVGMRLGMNFRHTARLRALFPQTVRHWPQSVPFLSASCPPGVLLLPFSHACELSVLFSFFCPLCFLPCSGLSRHCPLRCCGPCVVLVQALSGSAWLHRRPFYHRLAQALSPPWPAMNTTVMQRFKIDTIFGCSHDINPFVLHI